jgi:rod shape-determining protein MreD
VSTVIGAVVMALLAAIQSSLLARFPFVGGSPSLVLLACVSWSLAGRTQEAMVWAFVGGLCLDLLSGSPFGISAIALVAAVYVASLTEGRFWEAHLLAPVGVVAVTSVLYYGITMAAIWVAGHPVDAASALTAVILPSIFLNVLLALPAYQLAERVRESAFPPAVSLG